MTRRDGSMHAIVTGAAGFIGSHLAERLIGDGWKVTGIDAFTSYYARPDKEANLAALRNDDTQTVGVGKFIHLWRYKDGAWKVTRVISYDHR